MALRRWLAGMLLLSAAPFLCLAVWSPAADAAPRHCVVKVTATGLAGAALKTVKICDDGGTDAADPTPTLMCGEAGSRAAAALRAACHAGPDGELAACAHTVDGTPTVSTPFASIPVGSTKAQLWCPGDVVPAIAQDAIRAEAIRLLPTVPIGTAPTTTSLVNIETVLWASTGADRDLATAQVLGTDVRLRVNFDRADWTFGDGARDSTTEPGKAYDAAHDPCRSRQCEHYYGHTYHRTGRLTIGLTVTWTAQFSLDAGTTWTDLDQPITGTAATRVITVEQARAVLVPNPGEH